MIYLHVKNIEFHPTFAVDVFFFLNNELSSQIFREVEENFLWCEVMSILVLGVDSWMNKTFERKWHQVVSFFLNVLQFLIKPIVIEPSSRKSFICKRHITPIIILVFMFCCFFSSHSHRIHPSCISHFTELIYYSNLISILIVSLEYIYSCWNLKSYIFCVLIHTVGWHVL